MSENNHRRIRLWFHPSRDKGDYISAGGWAINGSPDEPVDSNLSFSYKNTEMTVNFLENAIEVTTYKVKADGEIGSKIQKHLFNYSDRKNKPDPPMERYTSHINLENLERPFVKADMRHCVVFKTSKKKKKS